MSNTNPTRREVPTHAEAEVVGGAFNNGKRDRYMDTRGQKPTSYPPNVAYPKVPWDRQNGESSLAYDAFCLYRDFGAERTFAAVEREVGCQVDVWKVDWTWHVRALKYDDWMEEQQRKRMERQRLAMAERQAGIGRKMQEVALKSLESGAVLPESVQDIARLVDVGVKVERLACGESTENVQEKQIQIVWSGSQPKWAPKADGANENGEVTSQVGDRKELPDSVGAGIPPTPTPAQTDVVGAAEAELPTGGGGNV